MTKEERKEYYRKYYQKNREKLIKKQNEYNQTPIGRATNLITTYTQEDKKHNRGQGDLTAEWVVENIFSQPCKHCGKEGWDVIGCNRIDNDKPHSKDNVEPCCKECNDNLAREEEKKEVYQYTLDGELVKIWSSTNECGRNGYNQGHISKCCNGKRQKHKGYKWSYNPL